MRWFPVKKWRLCFKVKWDWSIWATSLLLQRAVVMLKCVTNKCNKKTRFTLCTLWWWCCRSVSSLTDSFVLSKDQSTELLLIQGHTSSEIFVTYCLRDDFLKLCVRVHWDRLWGWCRDTPEIKNINKLMVKKTVFRKKIGRFFNCQFHFAASKEITKVTLIAAAESLCDQCRFSQHFDFSPEFRPQSILLAASSLPLATVWRRVDRSRAEHFRRSPSSPPSC